MKSNNLNKAYDASLHSAQLWNGMIVKSIQTISEIHSKAIREIAESMQRHLITVGSIRDPLAAPEILDADEINQIAHHFREYQSALTSASQDIGKEWVELMNTWTQDYKEDINNAFQETELNVPSGLEMIAMPLKVSFESALASFNQTQESISNAFQAFEQGLGHFEKSPQENTSHHKTKGNGASRIPVIHARKKSSRTVNI